MRPYLQLGWFFYVLFLLRRQGSVIFIHSQCLTVTKKWLVFNLLAKMHKIQDIAGNPTHSSNLSWRIPWTEEPGRLQSMGSDMIEWLIYLYTCVYTHTHTHTHTYIYIYICSPLKKLQVLSCPLKYVYTSVNQVPPLPEGQGGIHKIDYFLQFLVKFWICLGNVSCWPLWNSFIILIAGTSHFQTFYKPLRTLR